MARTCTRECTCACKKNTASNFQWPKAEGHKVQCPFGTPSFLYYGEQAYGVMMTSVQGKMFPKTVLKMSCLRYMGYLLWLTAFQVKPSTVCVFLTTS